MLSEGFCRKKSGHRIGRVDFLGMKDRYLERDLEDGILREIG